MGFNATGSRAAACGMWHVACGEAAVESINEISACKNCEMAMVMRLCQ